MPRGFEDYENPSYTVAARSIDLSQMVLSLTGTYSLDGLGRVIYADNFSEGLAKYQSAAVLFPGTLTASGIQAEVGPVSMRANVKVSLPGGNWEVYKSLVANALVPAGFQTSLAWYTAAPLTYLFLTYQVGAFQAGGALKVDPATRLVSYLTGVTWAPLCTLPTLRAQIQWVPIKLVVDLPHQEYKRVVVGQLTFDLAGVPSNSLFVAGRDNLTFAYDFEAYDATNRTGYAGHVLITLDDP